MNVAILSYSFILVAANVHPPTWIVIDGCSSRKSLGARALATLQVNAPNGYGTLQQQHKGGARRGERHQNVESLFIRDYFRRWLARFKLGAHFLDLSCLLFELRSENLHLFLLQGDGRFQVSDTGLLFLDFFVLFEELVEQHVVDLLVVDGHDFTVLAAHHELRIHLGDLLGDQTILRRAFPVAVEFEGYWLELVQRFTGLVHRLNVVFEPPRRVEDAHHVKLIDKYCGTWLPGSLTGSPKMLPMKQVLSRSRKGPAPGAPIAMLLLAWTRPEPAELPTATLLSPSMILSPDLQPTAVLLLLLARLSSARRPTATFSSPLVRAVSAMLPRAVLAPSVAVVPLKPVSAESPTATLNSLVVFSLRASEPMAVLSEAVVLFL